MMFYNIVLKIYINLDKPIMIGGDRLLDSLVVECWLRVQEVPGSIPRSRTASYQRRYENSTSSALV